MPNTKLGGNRWVPDIRTGKIETFQEGTDQYKIVEAHPILNKILDASAFFRTHANAVWYSKKENKSAKAKFDEIDELTAILNTPMVHRMLPRYKNLGGSLTQAQKDAIRTQSFKDLFIGDYWVINNRTWRIVDINYWLGKGDTSCTTPHVVVMPDANLYTHNMNGTNTTTGGYVGSEMYKTGLTQAKNIVTQDFGTNVLNHRELFTNTVAAGGYPSNGEWANSTVDLANEIMMYGCHVFSPACNGAVFPYRYTIDTSQLALFQANPYYIQPSRSWFWLRDVVSAASFARVAGNGAAHYGGASTVFGVRPVVGITG